MVNNFDLQTTEITLKQILDSNFRFDASAYDIEGAEAKKLIKRSGWSLRSIKEIVNKCYYPKRFRRHYVKYFSKNAIGFIGSSEMLDINPKPKNFLSDVLTDVDALKVNENNLLISRSGTIGNTVIINKTLSKFLFSEHCIRIESENYSSFLFIFFKSNTGQALLKSKIFGSVVNQIEPDDVNDIIIPIPDTNILNEIDKLIKKSNELIDLSNELEESAHNKLLDFIDVDISTVENQPLLSQSVNLKSINYRFDASYHNPTIELIKKKWDTNTNINNINTISEVSENIILPGRFKRNYVDKEHGTLFIGGKQIWQLDPNNKKYLSLYLHKERIQEQLTLKENMILVTCSGTIGKISLVPSHWDGWTANQHIMRISFNDKYLAAYTYQFLKTKVGQELILRHTYGSVVDELDDKQLSQVDIPILKNKDIFENIAKSTLKANELRSKAYNLQQEALNIFEKNVLKSDEMVETN
ncbi:TPA: restriction endonuclease subunit S [Staphylococcus aureus]|nr:restriction endonuclease subunit S [Staphylococcus aureus]